MDIEADLLVPEQPLPAGPITYEEFLVWGADEDTHAEWVDGQVILLPMVSERHAAILTFMHWLFGLATQFGRLGKVYSEPFQMRLRHMGRGRSPDLMFVLPEHQHLMERAYLDGPADIIVEIVSRESRRRDRVEKLDEYERAGAREYWLVDSERPGAEFRVLGPDGRYQLVFSGTEGAYQSAVLPQLRLRVEWLWQNPGPDLAEMLRELALAG